MVVRRVTSTMNHQMIYGDFDENMNQGLPSFNYPFVSMDQHQRTIAFAQQLTERSQNTGVHSLSTVQSNPYGSYGSYNSYNSYNSSGPYGTYGYREILSEEPSDAFPFTAEFHKPVPTHFNDQHPYSTSHSESTTLPNQHFLINKIEESTRNKAKTSQHHSQRETAPFVDYTSQFDDSNISEDKNPAPRFESQEYKNKNGNHVCGTCSRPFDRYNNLKSHIRTHQNHRPFVCSMCNLRFTRNHDLNRHMRTHTNTKPYQCRFCGKLFSRKDALVRHEKVGEKEKVPACFLNSEKEHVKDISIR